ncbi:MAG: hypothetical protein IT507_03930 [Burkholderiaceae bacterium]|nr:hypothetical protein [Burkholderiaceae bacterium]
MRISRLLGTLATMVSLALLGGCATTAGYQSMLQTWVGQNEQSLVTGWGAPSAVSESPPYRYLTFTRFSGYDYTTVGYGYGYGYYGYYGYPWYGYGAPGYTYATPIICTTMFALQNGVVVNSSFQGSGCVAN